MYFSKYISLSKSSALVSGPPSLLTSARSFEAVLLDGYGLGLLSGLRWKELYFELSLAETILRADNQGITEKAGGASISENSALSSLRSHMN